MAVFEVGNNIGEVVDGDATNDTHSTGVALPGGVQAGDLILVAFHLNSSQSVQVEAHPTGYTFEDGITNGGGAFELGSESTIILLSYHRVATGSDPTPTIQWKEPAAAGHASTQGRVVVFRGVDTDNYEPPTWQESETTSNDPTRLAVNENLLAGQAYVGWAAVDYDIRNIAASEGYEVVDQEIIDTNRWGRLTPEGLTVPKDGPVYVYIDHPDSASTFVLGYDVPPSPTEDRVRSNTSTTVGSLLEATDAPALESGVRESFFENVELPAGALYDFREALRPGDWQHTLAYYPNPLASQERLAEYAGSTNLGRMADAYPAPIRARAVDLVGTETMTAQELIDALFELWADEFPWFRYASVPDLRYRVEGDDYTGDRGVLRVEAVLYPQDEDQGRRLSMRQILDELLSIFPGTGILQNRNGVIVLRPTYGPDAPSSPSVTMTDEDAFSISTGDRPDPRRVYNRARVTSRGYEFQADQAIITPSYVLVSSVDETKLLATISNRERVAGAVGTIPYEGLVNTSQDIEVTYTAELYSMNSAGESLFLEQSETDTLTFAPGSEDVIFTIEESAGTAPIYSEWKIGRRADGILVQRTGGSDKVSDWTGRTWWIGHILKVDATGDAFVQRNESITARFGYDLTESEIVNADGENVLEQSQFKYGEREISISTDAFALTEGQAQEIAQGLVLHHITPRVVRTVEQSWWRAFPVLPDHIGKVIRLPSGADALVEERTYTDDYTNPLAPLLASTFRATLTEPIAKDPTETNPDVFDDANLLAFDSGAWLRFDDGTLVEKT